MFRAGGAVYHVIDDDCTIIFGHALLTSVADKVPTVVQIHLRGHLARPDILIKLGRSMHGNPSELHLASCSALYRIVPLPDPF